MFKSTLPRHEEYYCGGFPCGIRIPRGSAPRPWPVKYTHPCQEDQLHQPLRRANPESWHAQTSTYSYVHVCVSVHRQELKTMYQRYHSFWERMYRPLGHEHWYLKRSLQASTERYVWYVNSARPLKQRWAKALIRCTPHTNSTSAKNAPKSSTYQGIPDVRFSLSGKTASIPSARYCPRRKKTAAIFHTPTKTQLYYIAGLF